MEVLDFARLWGPLAGLVGVVVWGIRLEARCKANTEANDRLQAENQKQWEMITEDRKTVGDLKVAAVAQDKDTAAAMAKACRALDAADSLRKDGGAIERLWTASEGLSNRVTRLEAKTGINGGDD